MTHNAAQGQEGLTPKSNMDSKTSGSSPLHSGMGYASITFCVTAGEGVDHRSDGGQGKRMVE